MLKNRILLGWFLITLLIISVNNQVKSQVYDTIANWDGINQVWYVGAGGCMTTTNPAPDTVNSSQNCFKVITSEGRYDYMYYDMPVPANFDLFPRYRFKIFAPPQGGDMCLKFENSNNTEWQEIVKTPIPGQWDDLEFDFSGLTYNNFTRMVIFFDFLGTTPGIQWYIDDILKELPPPPIFESNLPLVVINTFGQTIPDEPKITAYMGIIDNGPGAINNLNDPFNDYDGYIGIEIRGSSTQMFPKKSYGVETRDETGANLNVSLLGLPEENDWILYAPYTDKSMLRNVVTYDLWRKTGNYCTRSVYCEVFINDDYKGVYILMEKIKKDENRVDISTLNPDEITGDDLTGGYIISVDKVPWNFTFGYDGWKSYPVPPYPNAMHIIFQYYYPEADVLADEQRTYIKDYFTQAENTLCSAGFKDPETGYQAFFDVPSFVDFMLLSELSKEVDKYRYSNYFHKDKDSRGGKIFAGPAWDFNLGYGNVDYWPPGIDYTGWIYPTVSPDEWSIMFWWKRFMEDPYFQNLARTRWLSLRENEWSDDHINAFIDSVLTLIDQAKDRNYERWPILGVYVWPNYNWQGNNYEDEVNYFTNFLFNRLYWIDSHIPGSILNPWIGITGNVNIINLTLFGDYFRSEILDTEDFQLNNAPGNITITSVEYVNNSGCILTLSSDITAFPDISVTLSERAINTYDDLTSNTLGTIGVIQSKANLPEIKIYEYGGQLNILCEQPDLLPARADILSIGGATLARFILEKKPLNTFNHTLQSGVYLLVIKTGSYLQVHKLVML